MASGMFVPQLVTPVDTSFLRQIGNTIGTLKQDSEIADILKGIDPYDPNSKQRVIGDLRAHSREGREMADRMEGLDIRRQTATQQGEYQKGLLDVQRQRYKLGQGKEEEQAAATEDLGRFITGDSDSAPAAAPRPAAPSPVFAPPATTPRQAPVRPAPTTGGAIIAQPPAVPPTAATEAAAAAAGPAPIGQPATRVPGTNANAATAVLGQRPLPPGPQVAAAGGVVPGVPVQQPAPAVAAGPPPTPAPVAVPAARERPEHPSTSDPYTERRPPSYEAMAPFLSKKPQEVAQPPDPTEVGQLLARKRELYRRLPSVNADGQRMIEAESKSIDERVKTIREQMSKFYEAGLTTSKAAQKEDLDSVRKLNDKLLQQRMDDQTALLGLKDSHESLQRGLQTGGLNRYRQWTGEMLNEGRTLARAIGIPESKLEWMQPGIEMAAGLEKFAGLSAKGLFDNLGGFAAGNSNADRQVLELSMASLPKTIEGNKQLVEFHMLTRIARMESIAAVQVYIKHRTENMQTLGPPTTHDISEIQNRYHREAVDRIGTLAGIDAAGARNMNEKDLAIARKEARVKAKVQEDEAEAFRRRWSGDVKGAAGRAVEAVRSRLPAAQEGARELLRGDNPATRFFQGAGRPGYGAEGVPLPQRLVGEDLSDVDYSTMFGSAGNRNPLPRGSLGGIVEQGSRLAPGGIPVEAMRSSTNVEDRTGGTLEPETPERALARNPALRNQAAFEEWQKAYGRDWDYENQQTPHPYPDIARQAGLADLEAPGYMTGLRRRNFERDRQAVAERARQMGGALFAGPTLPLPLPPGRQSKATEEAERRRRNRRTPE